ncbi:unnamed protein product [Sympodiomycopsis kandeliae]
MSVASKAALAPGGAVSSNTLLARYLSALNANPLRTKMITSGVLSALAEVLAGHLAGVASSKKSESSSSRHTSSGITQQLSTHVNQVLTTLGLNDRALKMFIYGYAISAPLGHVMTGLLQKAFAGKTTPKDKILQIITSSLTVTVIANVVYLASMAVVNGARSVDKILLVVKSGIWRMLQISWLTSPAALAFAQNYLQPQLWEPFFTLLRFFLSTYFNTMAKKKQVALAKKEALKKGAQSQAEKDTADSQLRDTAASERK